MSERWCVRCCCGDWLVGPFDLEGSVEPFDLAVLPWAVRADRDVAGSDRVECMGKRGASGVIAEFLGFEWTRASARAPATCSDWDRDEVRHWPAVVMRQSKWVLFWLFWFVGSWRRARPGTWYLSLQRASTPFLPLRTLCRSTRVRCGENVRTEKVEFLDNPDKVNGMEGADTALDSNSRTTYGQAFYNLSPLGPEKLVGYYWPPGLSGSFGTASGKTHSEGGTRCVETFWCSPYRSPY